MTERVALQPAYILHRRPYRESSLLLDIFTPAYGRLAGIARGARRGRSAAQALLQPFSPIALSWSGRGEMVTVTGVEGRTSGAPLPGRQLITAFYLNELILRVLPRHDPHPDLFAAYEYTLRHMAANADPWLLRLFEKTLLQEIGYGLLLEYEADSGAEIQSQASYCYDLDAGPRRETASCNGQVRVQGSTLLALAGSLPFDAPAQQEAKRLMRAALAPHLGGRPLYSRELFRQTRSRMGADLPDKVEEP